jgi:O-antigen/teichoic acid export membrane protein
MNIRSILLDNKTIRQTIFKNTFWLGVGLGAERFLRLILLVYAAGILGATEYGKFTFALAFISLLVIFFNFGLPPIIIREFAREKEKQKEFYSIISLKILLSIVGLLIVFFGSFFITSDPAIQRIILILAIFSTAESFISIFGAFFHAHQRMEYQAWTEILKASLMTGIGLFLLLKFPSVNTLSYSYLVASFLALIFALLLFHFKFLPLNISWQKSVWKKFLIMSWPVALVGVFSALYVNIDSVMMGYWGQITETGWYNAAYRIIFITIIPGALISRSFSPVLSKFFKESKENLSRAWSRQMELMILAAIPLIIGGVVLAPRIILSFYSLSFFPSILAFQILIIAAGIIFLYRPFMDIMIVSNQQKKVFWISLFGAAVNIILNFILIPKYSLYGAAAATLVTYFFVLLVYLKYTANLILADFLLTKFLFTGLIAVAGSLLMYLVIRMPLVYNLNIFLSVILGGATYFLSLLGFKTIFKILKIYEFSW